MTRTCWNSPRSKPGTSMTREPSATPPSTPLRSSHAAPSRLHPLTTQRRVKPAQHGAMRSPRYGPSADAAEHARSTGSNRRTNATEPQQRPLMAPSTHTYHAPPHGPQPSNPPNHQGPVGQDTPAQASQQHGPIPPATRYRRRTVPPVTRYRQHSHTERDDQHPCICRWGARCDELRRSENGCVSWAMRAICSRVPHCSRGSGGCLGWGRGSDPAIVSLKVQLITAARRFVPVTSGYFRRHWSCAGEIDSDGANSGSQPRETVWCCTRSSDEHNPPTPTRFSPAPYGFFRRQTIKRKWRNKASPVTPPLFAVSLGVQTKRVINRLLCTGKPPPYGDSLPATDDRHRPTNAHTTPMPPSDKPKPELDVLRRAVASPVDRDATYMGVPGVSGVVQGTVMSDARPTELNATQRDVLSAIGAAMSGREQPPTTQEVRRLAAELSARISDNGTGTFTRALSDLRDEGYVESIEYAEDRRQKALGLTRDGEAALEVLAERSAEAVEGGESA